MEKLKIFLTIVLLLLFHLSGRAQENDSIVRNPENKMISIAIPASLIAYGAVSMGNNGIRKTDYSLQNHLLKKNSPRRFKADDYLLFSPALVAFGMKAGGVKSAHKAVDMTLLYVLSNVVSTGITQGSKRIILRERPDRSNRHSFPSGHTATAFVAAEFLHQEYKDQSIWISVGGYAMASLVGASRIYNNKHWLSDVAAGAGVGILSTKLVYATYPHLQRAIANGKNKNKTNRALLFPGYGEGHWSVNLSYTF